MDNVSQDLKSNVTDLEKLCKNAMVISQNAANIKVTWFMVEASIIFVKIVFTSIAILRFIPESKYFSSVCGMKIWDITSIAFLTRNLIETYLALYYIAIDDVSVDEKELRKLFWKYHEASERVKMLSYLLPKSKNLPNLKACDSKLKEQLEKSERFQNLPAWKKKQLLKGSQNKTFNNRENCQRAGLSLNFYNGVYKYLSNFVHTSPYSISEFDSAKFDSKEAQEHFNMLTNYTSGIMAFAIRDFTKSMPELAKYVSHHTENSIHIWEDTFQWDKSEFY